jgi:hypothetical protein
MLMGLGSEKSLLFIGFDRKLDLKFLKTLFSGRYGNRFTYL